MNLKRNKIQRSDSRHSKHSHHLMTSYNSLQLEMLSDLLGKKLELSTSLSNNMQILDN